jgi:hypothetical protein
MKIKSASCNNRATQRTDGEPSSPSAFSAARETPCGFLPALFRQFELKMCTIGLHNSYTGESGHILPNEINTLKQGTHFAGMTKEGTGAWQRQGAV